MDPEKIRQATRLFLEAIGEDPARPCLARTPERLVRLCEEIFGGMGRDPARILETVPGETHDEIVLVRDIPFYSVCEHHLLPFHGRAHVAYLPDGFISGLSKLARVVEVVARRLQIQERLTTEIADVIMKTLKPQGVMVVVEAEHLCMTMRGVKAPGAMTVTSAVRGIFRNNPATRSEALSLIYRSKS
ncbi:MAG: GTP cyclohydrolase I FolE [Planctomycetota bacterium]